MVTTMKYERLGPVRNPFARYSPEHQLDRDEIFEMLSNRRRQCIIHYLKRHAEDGPVPMRELVDYVSAWENEVPLQNVDPIERKRVYNALRQTHLPKLAETGMIEYDADNNLVQLSAAAQTMQLYLEYVPASDIPWHGYYLGLSILTSFLIALVWSDTYPFGTLEETLILGLALSLFIISSIVHSIYARWNRIEIHEQFQIPSS